MAGQRTGKLNPPGSEQQRSLNPFPGRDRQVDAWSADQPLLAFVHIEKAAGTTLIHVLRRNYALRYLDVRPLHAASSGVFTARDLRTCLRINPLLRCIGGHAVTAFSDLASVAPQIRYITLLRDPVERYFSQYGYWVSALKKSWSFERFLDHEPSHDFQTRKIAGCSDVNAAKRLLAERFFVVGTAEQFDDFLITLRQRLRPARFDSSYVRRNVSPDQDLSVAERLDRYHDRIMANNLRDIELYRYAVADLIPRQTALYGADVPAGRSTSAGGFGSGVRLFADSICRKAYYEPITGILRRLQGMPMKGSY